MKEMQREWERQVEILIEELPDLIQRVRKDHVAADKEWAIATGAVVASSKLFMKMLKRYDEHMEERIRKLEKQAGRAITRRDSSRTAESEGAASIEEFIKEKRKYAEVHVGIGRIVDPEEMDAGVLIPSFLNQFDCFMLNPELEERDDVADIRTLLEYAISKQMVHDFEEMSGEEASSIVDRFFGLFNAKSIRMFTNATYRNGLAWRSIMKERRGTVYFDTGVVIIADDRIGLLWIADPG